MHGTSKIIDTFETYHLLLHHHLRRHHLRRHPPPSPVTPSSTHFRPSHLRPWSRAPQPPTSFDEIPAKFRRDSGGARFRSGSGHLFLKFKITILWRIGGWCTIELILWRMVPGCAIEFLIFLWRIWAVRHRI